MTCSGCQRTVEKLLSAVPGVRKADVDLTESSATVEMDKHVPVQHLQDALASQSKFRLSEQQVAPASIEFSGEEKVSWLKTYRPILLVFAYITGISVIAGFIGERFNWYTWMNYFMAGFFLAFSFFKFLDLRGFADSYAMYDVIAAKWKGWGFVYPFVELGLGLAFLSGFELLLTNGVTFVVMSVSIVGVLRSVMNKRKIRCACLGAVFNLPMSTITIIEDALMIGMSLFMLISMS